MNKLFKISVILTFSIVIWFCITDNYLAAQHILVGKMDIENNQQQESNSHQKTFNFEDEENHHDTSIDLFNTFFYKNSFCEKVYSFNEFSSASFFSIIWQPPKI